MPTITREQLESIQWNGRDYDGYPCCPACGRAPTDGHNDVCLIAAALATPDTLPPVEVGDVVALDMEGYGLALTPVDADGDVLVVDFNGYEHTSQHTHYNYSAEAVTAVYRRIWQRGKE
jgi:hypothetical protein